MSLGIFLSVYKVWSASEGKELQENVVLYFCASQFRKGDTIFFSGLVLTVVWVFYTKYGSEPLTRIVNLFHKN